MIGASSKEKKNIHPIIINEKNNLIKVFTRFSDK